MSPKNSAHAQGPQVQAQAEYGVRREALQPGVGRLRRSRGGDAESEGRLHEEEGKYDGDQAVEQRGQQRRASKPVTGGQGDEDQSEYHANAVVGDPADLALEGFRCGGDDTRMSEGSL